MATKKTYLFKSTPTTKRRQLFGGASAQVTADVVKNSLSINTTAAGLQTDLNTMYQGSNLAGKVTGVGNYGWQKFVVEQSGTYTAVVRGGSGGTCNETACSVNAVTGATGGTPTVGYYKKGGRGAKIVGTFHASAGDVLYLLVGFHGNDQYGSFGAGGGGASVILRENPNGQYTLTPANKKVEVLIVAGGGGGSAGGKPGNSRAGVLDGRDAVVTNGTSTNGGVIITSGNTSASGGGLTGDGTNHTAQAFSILSGTIGKGSTSSCSTWGSGGGAQGSGGGGGGYSGGNAADSNSATTGSGGYGGTSYINPAIVTQVSRGYATVAEDGSRDLVNPWNAYGAIELSLESVEKWILAQDEDGIKYFDGFSDTGGGKYPSATNTWLPLPDDVILGEQAYKDYGKFVITNRTGLKDDAKFLVMSPEESTDIAIRGNVNQAMVKQTSDANLGDTSLIKSVTYTGNLSGTIIKFAISKNSGKTWQTFNGTSWVDIDIEDRQVFYDSGYDLSLIGSIPVEKWNEYNAKNLRFAFTLTQTAATTATILNTITMLRDLTGSWRKAKEEDGYYEYTSTDNLKVTFSKTGNYKVNYLDNLGSAED